jgi:hypothetical protein
MRKESIQGPPRKSNFPLALVLSFAQSTKVPNIADSELVVEDGSFSQSSSANIINYRKTELQIAGPREKLFRFHLIANMVQWG